MGYERTTVKPGAATRILLQSAAGNGELLGEHKALEDELASFDLPNRLR
jgi:hypothetical protein